MRRTQLGLLPMFLGLWLLAAADETWGQSVLNGSFENPVVTTNSTQNVAPTSWTWESTPGALFNGKVADVWPTAESGKQFVDIGNQALYSLAQTITVTNQGDFELRWFDATALSTTEKTSPYAVSVLNSSFQTVVSTNFDAYRPEGNWKGRTLRAQLTKGTYLLRFQAQGTAAGLDTLLDNVSIASLPSDLVPTIQVSAVNVCWAGRSNETYQVQYKSTVTSNAWVNLGEPTAGAGTNCVPDTVTGNDKRFYRVLRLE